MAEVKKGFWERLGFTVKPANPLPAGKGIITAGHTSDEVEPKISKTHMFYGNDGPISPSEVARAQAKERAIAQGLLKQAYDPNKKAIRVTCVDPSDEVF